MAHVRLGFVDAGVSLGLVAAFALAWLTGDESQCLHNWLGRATLPILGLIAPYRHFNVRLGLRPARVAGSFVPDGKLKRKVPPRQEALRSDLQIGLSRPKETLPCERPSHFSSPPRR
jgi:hypothetical protein